MTTSAQRLLFWAPRVLGILVALYLGLFALDATDEGTVAVLVHLIPSFILLALVAAAWRWEWLGGTLYLVLALTYAVLAWRRDHVDWSLVISVPLLLVGILFLWSWR